MEVRGERGGSGGREVAVVGPDEEGEVRRWTSGGDRKPSLVSRKGR